MDKSSKIYVAGHKGLVGSSIVRELKKQGYENLILKDRNELDLICTKDVENFFSSEKPDYVFLSAAKVGGIHANNTYPAEFIYENLQIQNNIIHFSYKNKVKKLLFLGSSCIYPKNCTQPMKEEYLMTSKLEPTNEPYAIAKIAGITMCKSYCRQYGVNFISAMPTNLYGINDNFHLDNSHVLPALISKFHTAKANSDPVVQVWGSGKPLREFLFVDDLAEACIFLMKNYSDSEIINIGTGEDISILDLANLIKEMVGYSGKIQLDASKPDGTPRKLLDVAKINSLGWKSKTGLNEGLKKTYDWYLNNLNLVKQN